jgi:hypothetical protein
VNNLISFWGGLLEVLEWIDHHHGIWAFLDLSIAATGLGVAIKLIWFPKQRIRNLNFSTWHDRSDPHFPLRVMINIRNFTGRSVVLVSKGFTFKSLRVMQGARGHSASKEYECKFPDSTGSLNTMEYLLQHRQDVLSWMPLDPSHTDQEVKDALDKHSVGLLALDYVMLEDKPKVQALNQPI